jgi:purine nucleosidase
MIGLDVTRNARLRKEHIERIDNEPVRALLMGLSADYMLMFQRKHGDEAILLHDPLAVYAAVTGDNGVVAYENWGVKAVHHGENRGSTDPDPKRPVVKVAMQLDAERFVGDFCRALELV